jgi:uncharacterized RmlC-like cupin family protein
VSPYVPHQEINASENLQLHCFGETGPVYKLDIERVQMPQLIRWIDDLHT